MGCVRCGGAVPLSRGTKPTKWCSESCRTGSYYWRAKAVKPPICRVYFGLCRECGVPWSSRSGATKYCSPDCRQRFLYRRELESGRSRKYVERRRVRKNQAPSETIERLVVADRDGWVCWLCCEPIDRELGYPDRKSLSIDHVVPLSRGGSHTYANVRASHLDCNVKRGVSAAARVA